MLVCRCGGRLRGEATCLFAAMIQDKSVFFSVARFYRLWSHAGFDFIRWLECAHFFLKKRDAPVKLTLRFINDSLKKSSIRPTIKLIGLFTLLCYKRHFVEVFQWCRHNDVQITKSRAMSARRQKSGHNKWKTAQNWRPVFSVSNYPASDRSLFEWASTTCWAHVLVRHCYSAVTSVFSIYMHVFFLFFLEIFFDVLHFETICSLSSFDWLWLLCPAL